MALWRGLFGARNDRVLRRYRKAAAAVGGLEAAMRARADDDFPALTASFQQRLAGGETPTALLPEAFAAVREAARRALQMRHFDEQVIGGAALFEGKIAEMKTGEGKTLAATMPVYLRALAGRGAHVVTVNDYLARRDAEWMGAVYRFLGMRVGVNVPGVSAADKRDAYAADITYGTNNEFGFDYLRDNMRFAESARAQRDLHYAIVDEVDSILIDEARTPLIISGEAGDSVDLYRRADAIAAKFVRGKPPAAKIPGETPPEDGDFSVDEKSRQINLTEAGYARAEKIFAAGGLLREGGLYDAANLPLLHHLTAALRANHLFALDRDYVVQNGEVVIVDEFTGRLMPGRRWSDGLHQAVEAKEKLQVQRENQTLAAITFQNYFRLYDTLAGMTGTAVTEAHEFQYIYGLETVEIPTHRRMIRADEIDKVYQATASKTAAVIEDIKACQARGQPVLVGTTSIDSSEKLSAMLAGENIVHQVLNAKQHAREALIIAQAGARGAVTIATNMAGRGTDIVLGGNIDAAKREIENNPTLAAPARAAQTAALHEKWRADHEQVIAAGGLRIIGTERHESRRIDNQLRGRAGRQGDPGSSVFYLSFEDPLLRIFASERVAAIMHRLKIPADEAIEARLVSRVIANAQRKVEAHNFDIRKQLLEYDDIANEQRRVIYAQRGEILRAADPAAIARDLREDYLAGLIGEHIPPESPEEEWRAAALEARLKSELRLSVPVAGWLAENEDLPREQLAEKITAAAEDAYREKTADADAEQFAAFERSLILNAVDSNWRGHLSALDHLRHSVGLRGFAQKNPKQEYKREAFDMFAAMLEAVKADVARILYGLQIRAEAPPPTAPAEPPPQKLQYRHDDAAAVVPPGRAAPAPAPAAESGQQRPYRRTAPKVRRNDPCPCGSGKKYKQCHGKLQ